MRRGRRWVLGLVAVLATPVSAEALNAGSWSSAVIPHGIRGLTAISCVGKGGHAGCVAVGQLSDGSAAWLQSDDGGHSWSLHGNYKNVSKVLYDVSCERPARSCSAVGQGTGGSESAAFLTELGAPPKSLPAGAGVLTAVRCRANGCLALAPRSLGNQVGVTHNAGRTWSKAVLPLPGSFSGVAFGIALVDTKTGYAVGGAQCGGHVTECSGFIWRTTDGGDHWHLVFNGAPFVDRIACTDRRHCWAAAATFKTGVMLRTTDGGKHWARQSLPAFGGYFNGVACEPNGSGGRCWAVGQNQKGTAPVIMGTSDGGSHWLRYKAPNGTGALYGVTMADGGKAVGTDKGGGSAVVIDAP